MPAIDPVGGWPFILGALVAGRDLTAAQAEAALASVLAGEATPAQTAALIVALRMKGEAVDELAGMVGAMLDAASPLLLDDDVIDIVGTGGSPRRRARALNVSTMASLVAAGAGARVCKHGNIKASSTSGAFDLVAALGIRQDVDGPHLEALVAELGIGFCFARAFHPAMRHAGPVRAELGVPTVFNVLGPLSHPGRLSRQVIGVGDGRLLDLVAGVLAARGARHALVVHGADALDEISLSGPTHVREVRDGAVVNEFDVTPEEFGFDPVAVDDMPGGTPDENAVIAHALFAGEPGPARNIVVMNAAAGLYVAGRAESLVAGTAMAQEAIDRGAVSDLLARLVEASNR